MKLARLPLVNKIGAVSTKRATRLSLAETQKKMSIPGNLLGPFREFSGEFYSFQKLVDYFVGIYTVYSKTINEIFISEEKIDEIKKNLNNMIKEYFTREDIEKKVVKMLEPLKISDSNKSTIGTEEINRVLGEKSVLKVIQIREFLFSKK